MEKKQSLVVSKMFMTLLVAFMISFLCGTQAKAATAPGKVTGVKQTDARAGGIDIAWNSVPGSMGYRVWMSTTQNGTYEVVQKTRATENKATIVAHGISDGKSYWVKVQAGVRIGNMANLTYGELSAPIEVVTLPDTGINEIKHIKSTKNSLKLKWTSVSGANTYRITYLKNGSKNEKVVYTTKTSIELKNLSKDSEYCIDIHPGRKTKSFAQYNVNLHDNGFIMCSVQPSKVSGLDVTNYWGYSGYIGLECKENKVANGYEWECWTAYAKKNSRVKKVSSTSPNGYIENSALKKHNFFKVRVRAYNVDSNGKKYYSPWSSWKHTCQQPDVKIKNSKKGQTVSWDKIKGADRYVLYMSTKPMSGYKKAVTTTKTKTLVTKFNKKKLKSGKTYYYYVVAYNKDGKKYYSGEARYTYMRWNKKYSK